MRLLFKLLVGSFAGAVFATIIAGMDDYADIVPLVGTILVSLSAYRIIDDTFRRKPPLHRIFETVRVVSIVELTIGITLIVLPVIKPAYYIGEPASNPTKRPRVAFDAPNSMREDETKPAYLDYFESISIDQLIKQVRARRTPDIAEDHRTTDQIDLQRQHDRITVTLDGIGFKIQPQGPQIRDVDKNGHAKLQWQVQADKLSSDVIEEPRYLNLTIIAQDGRTSTARTFDLSPTEPHEIIIKAKPLSLVERAASLLDNVSKVWLLGIAPCAAALGFFLSYFRSRMRPPQQDGEDLSING